MCFKKHSVIPCIYLNEIIQREEIMEAWYRKIFNCWATLSVSLTLCLFFFFFILSFMSLLSFFVILSFCHFCHFLSFFVIFVICLFVSLSLFSRGGEGRAGQGRGGEGSYIHTYKYIHMYIHTYIHTDPLTKWVVEELSLLKMYWWNISLTIM